MQLKIVLATETTILTMSRPLSQPALKVNFHIFDVSVKFVKVLIEFFPNDFP